jgi:hypothetical protein
MERCIVSWDRDAVCRTVALHVLAIPLWSLRAAANPLRRDSWLGAVVALDVCLVCWHWKANRISELAPGGSSFGTVESWTKLLYVPELIAAYSLVLDAWHSITVLTHR